MDWEKTKICTVGIQGSGKTELIKSLMRGFKKPIWYLVHLDDLERMPSNVQIVVAKEKTIQELNGLCRVVIDKAIAGETDCMVIDEADMFIPQNRPLARYLNDLVINHRHYGLTVIFITRRPQDIPAKIIESCEHLLIFALPNSTNIDRKLNAIDRNLLGLLSYLSKKNHNFIYKRLAKNPILMKAILLKDLPVQKNKIVEISEFVVGEDFPRK